MSRLEPANIVTRFTITDVLSAVFLIALCPSLVMGTTGNLVDTLVTFALSLAAGLAALIWGGTLCHTFGYKKFWQRFLIQCYAFLSTVGFVALIAVIGFSPQIQYAIKFGSFRERLFWFAYFLVMLFGLSMLFVEWQRRRKEEESGNDRFD